MLDLDLLDRIISGFGETNIIVRPNQCVKFRYPRAKCQRCVDTCPASAINLEEKTILDEYQCTSCGICTRVCPSGVFQLERAVEKNVFAQIQECLKRGDKAYLICERIDRNSAFSSEDNLIQLPCLGIVDESLLLSLASRGLHETALVTFGCESCVNGKGLRIIDETLETSQKLFAALDLKGCSLGKMETLARVPSGEVENVSPKEVHLYRRELLADLGNAPLKLGMSVGRAVMTLLLPGEKEGRFERRQNVPRRHRHLIEAIRELATEDARGKNVSYLPAKKIWIDDRCSGCSVCSTLCPTHALSRREKDSFVAVDFNLSYCVGCGLCKEACPEKAIRYEDEITVGEMLDDSYRKLREVTLLHCELCQSRYFSREGGNLCPSCKKRKDLSFSH